MKKQIEHVQVLEYDDCDNSLRKSVIQQTLEFSDLIVEFYQNMLPPPSVQPSSTHLLSILSAKKFINLLQTDAPLPTSDLVIYEPNKEYNFNNDNDFNLSHAHDDYYFMKFLNLESTDKVIDLLKLSKFYEPITNTSDTDELVSTNTA